MRPSRRALFHNLRIGMLCLLLNWRSLLMCVYISPCFTRTSVWSVIDYCYIFFSIRVKLVVSIVHSLQNRLSKGEGSIYHDRVPYNILNWLLVINNLLPKYTHGEALAVIFLPGSSQSNAIHHCFPPHHAALIQFTEFLFILFVFKQQISLIEGELLKHIFFSLIFGAFATLGDFNA